MNDLKFSGTVRQGRIKYDTPAKYLVFLASLEGKRIELTLQKERNNRTLSQNRLYWGVVVDILADYFGYTAEEMHSELKRKFNPVHSKIDIDTTFGGSTTKLSTVEFTEYMEKIKRWASIEYHVYIPDANEVNFE